MAESLSDVAQSGIEVAAPALEIREAGARVGEYLAHLGGIAFRRQGTLEQGPECGLGARQIAAFFATVGEVMSGTRAADETHQHRVDRHTRLLVVAGAFRAADERHEHGEERQRASRHRAPQWA